MQSTIPHFTRLADLGVRGVGEILDTAQRWKGADPGAIFNGKLLGMVFFNPSLRTRASFEAAMQRGGGGAIVLEVGGGVWKLEDRDGVVMNGDRAEHVREAVPVLARYVDALAVRTFAALENADDDETDRTLNAFRRFSTVPVVSMESAREHPCQGLADMLTLREKLGELRGLPVTLSWAPHVKSLPLAVPHSFLLTAAACGCDIRVAHPPGFELHPKVIGEAQTLARESGASIRFTGDQAEALRGSRAVYVKSWAPMTVVRDAVATAKLYDAHRDWMMTRAIMDAAGSDPLFMHCLPVRRNVVVADDVLDHPSSVVVDEAENRFHVQRAILHRLWHKG